MHRVTFLLDEVFSILHELPQGHHGVVVNIELVVSWPRFHGNQHNPGAKLLLENLENNCKCNYILKVVKSVCEWQGEKKHQMTIPWHRNWLTGFLLLNISSCSITTAVVKQWVWSIWSCHQSAAHYRRLDGGKKGKSLKDKDGANWMANKNICFHEMEICRVTRQTPEKRTGAKPLCFKLNANSLITKLTQQRGSGRRYERDSNLAPATPPNPLHLGLCT